MTYVIQLSTPAVGLAKTEGYCVLSKLQDLELLE